MSLYYHVANKSEILDGIVDCVFSEIDLPTVDGDWRAEIARRAISARTSCGATPGRSGSWSRAPPPAPPPCATTTPCSAPCAEPASPSR